MGTCINCGHQTKDGDFCDDRCHSQYFEAINMTPSKLREGLKIKKIISGGQTGADQGGLEAGLDLGLQTGGLIPKRFRTEVGNCPGLGKKFGLVEHASYQYPPRTIMNVRDSDGTMIVGNKMSYGSRLTWTWCNTYQKPVFFVETLEMIHSIEFMRWITENKIETLNVAGNRESGKKGIQEFTREFIVHTLGNK